MKKIVVFLVLIVLGQSCNDNNPISDPCKDIDCFTPPGAFRFKVIDKDSRENLFTNGTYDKNDIEVINLKNDSKVNFRFLEGDNLNVIRIGSIGWKKEIVDAEIKVSDKLLFNLYVDAERAYGDCCSYTKYNEKRVYNCDFELDSNNGMYSILIDTK